MRRWAEEGRREVQRLTCRAKEVERHLGEKGVWGGRDTDVQVRSGQFRAFKLIHQSKTGTAKGSEGTNMSH